VWSSIWKATNFSTYIYAINSCQLSNAKKLIVAALANTREVAQAALDDYVANYMGPTEAAMANSQALGRN
jgi:hypothetical protein